MQQRINLYPLGQVVWSTGTPVGSENEYRRSDEYGAKQRYCRIRGQTLCHCIIIPLSVGEQGNPEASIVWQSWRKMAWV